MTKDIDGIHEIFDIKNEYIIIKCPDNYNKISLNDNILGYIYLINDNQNPIIKSQLNIEGKDRFTNYDSIYTSNI
jgi:hypothetical protein